MQVFAQVWSRGSRASITFPRILNFRYSDRFMRPSSQTTIDATVSLPWIVEMSKHSIRRGSDGQPEDDAQRLERVVVGGDVLVEARLVGDLRVARREVEQAALLAALRHDQAHAAPGLARQPALEHLGVRLGKRRPAGGSPAAPMRSA